MPALYRPPALTPTCVRSPAQCSSGNYDRLSKPLTRALSLPISPSLRTTRECATMDKVPLEHLLAEVEDVLRTMPPAQNFGDDSPENFAWCGRAQAVVHAWSPTRAILTFDPQVERMNSRLAKDVESGIRMVLTMLHQVRNDLRLRSQGPLSLNVGAGAVFDYFDEVRKVVETYAIQQPQPFRNRQRCVDSPDAYSRAA